MRKLFVITGFSGKHRDILPWEDEFGKTSKVIYVPYDTHLRKPLTELAEGVRDVIKSQDWHDGETADLFGFSAGGLIGEHYVKFLDEERISRFVSACAPRHGTYLAYAHLGLDGVKDMRPRSRFLVNLLGTSFNDRVVRHFYWNPIDGVTIPGSSARDGKYDSEYFFSLCHPLNMYSHVLMRKVQRFFEKTA